VYRTKKNVNRVLALLFLSLVLLRAGGQVFGQPATTAAPVSEKEAQAFAFKIQFAVLDGKADLFNSLVDWEAIIATATQEYANYTGMKEVLNDFRKGIQQGVTNPEKGMAVSIINAIKGNGNYKFLRVHNKGGYVFALFRMVSGAGGVNYHDMLLDRMADGTIKIKNIQVALTGEYITESLNRSALPFIQKKQKENLDKLSEQEKKIYQQTEAVMKFMRSFNDPKKLLAQYDGLPEQFKNSKHALIMLMNTAYNTKNEEVYTASINSYQKQFPDSPTIDLLLIDRNTQVGKYDEVLKSINAVEKIVGNDPHLDNLRSETYYKKGDFKLALEYAERAVKNEPTLVTSYWTVLGISLKIKDYNLTAKYLTLVERKLKISLADLTKVPDYAGFVDSPQYSEWMKTRPKKNQEEK
jgi:hypothetical protein